jgi:zinc/manganese transport system permease protein
MSYFDRALVVVILIGALSGLVGVLVVLRRRVLFTQALTHATFPGAVIATVLGASMQLGAVIACLSLALVLAALGRLRGQGSQAASGVLLTAGFAAGVVLQALNPSIPVQIDSFLFGSVLSATWVDAGIAAAGLVLVVVALLLWGKQVLFFLFDKDGFRASGFSTFWIDALLLTLATIAVVASIPAAGAILAISLIAAPAAAARFITDRFFVLLWLAPVLGSTSGVLGLLASRAFGVSAGASIALIAAVFFLAAWGNARLRQRNLVATRIQAVSA